MIGRVLKSRYQLGAELGRGSMGVVHRARDLVIGRTVAVKLIDLERLDPSARGRLWREAQAAGRLCHPHIVLLHDFDETDGQPFLVMECVNGASLRDRPRTG